MFFAGARCDPRKYITGTNDLSDQFGNPLITASNISNINGTQMRNQNSNSTPAVAYEVVPDGFGNYWYSAKGYQANYGSTFSSSVKTFEFTLTTTSTNETLSVNSISYDFATAFNNSSLGASFYVAVGFWYYNESSSSYTK